MRNCIPLIIFAVVLLNSCYAQNNNTMDNKDATNPLLCDVETGMCEMPTQSEDAVATTVAIKDKPIKVIYFTDPICSSCWGIEPQLRKLKQEYKDYIEVEYHMGGLLPDWSYNSGGISKPSDVAHHWDEVSGHYDMPIDGDVWLEDPLPSSYPPSIAFKAAQMQDQKKALTFLRKMREFVFLQKKNITKWEHLEAAALYSGLDAIQLKKDYEGTAKAAFQADLALAKSMRVRGFPSLFFMDEEGNSVFVYGAKPYEAFEQAVQKLAPNAEKAAYEKGYDALFAKYPTWTAKEFATLSGMKRKDALAFLEIECHKGRLKKISTKNGNLYFKK